MKKLLSHARSAGRFLMALAVCCTGIVSAQAETITLNDSDIALTTGQEYLVPAYKKILAHFDAPKTGKLTITNGGDLGIYSQAVINDAYAVHDYDTPVLGQDIKVLNAVEGTTYYFMSNFTMNEKVMTLNYEQPLDISYFQPQALNANDEGTPIDFNNYPSLIITFNQAVALAENAAYIQFTDRLKNEPVLINATLSSAGVTATVGIYNAVRNYLISGALKATDIITVTIPGITSKDNGSTPATADANGNLVFKFKCGGIPVTLTSKSCPDPFLSYWPKGDAAGKVTLTFNEPLGNFGGTYAQFLYGSPEGADGTWYLEQLPIEIAGNTVTVDLTGVLRTPETMTPKASEPYSAVQVMVKGIVDENNIPVGSDGQGTVGSYTFAPAFKLLERANVAYEFTPEIGSSLATADNIEIWMTGVNGMLSFSGFNVACTNENGDVQNINIPLSQVTVNQESADETTYTFAVPAAAKTAKAVVVTLADLVSYDGYDHASDVRGVYNTFAITYSEPSNGSKLAQLNGSLGANSADATTISVNLSNEDAYPDMYVEYEIVDVTNDDEIVKSFSQMKAEEFGGFSSEVILDVTLFVGHEYHVVVTAWANQSDRNYGEAPLGSDFFVLYGATQPYHFSDLSIVEINPTPNDNFILPADTQYIEVTFDGLVRLNEALTKINTGMGTSQDFKALTPVDPQTVEEVVYATKWQLVFPDGYVAKCDAPITFNVAAFDENGEAIKGDAGVDAGSYSQYTFNVPGMFGTLTFDFGTEPVYSVSEITVGCEIGIAYGYNVAMRQAQVLDLTGSVVATVTNITDMGYDFSEDKVNTEVYLHLNEPITAAGTYVLMIPEKYFALGTEFNAKTSPAVNERFYIEAEPVAGDLPEFTPAEGTVTTLSQIEIVYTKEDEIGIGSGKATLSVNGADATALPDAELDWDTWNKAIQPLGNTYTADGTYVVTFPAGYFVLGAGGDRESDAMTLTYNIGDNTGVAVDIVADHYTVYTLEGVKVLDTDAKDALRTLAPGIYVVNGLKVALK